MNHTQARNKYQRLIAVHRRGFTMLSEFLGQRNELFCKERNAIENEYRNQTITRSVCDAQIEELKTILDMPPMCFESVPEGVRKPLSGSFTYAAVRDVGKLLGEDFCVDEPVSLVLRIGDFIEPYTARFKSKKESLYGQDECFEFEGKGSFEGYRNADCIVVIFKDRTKVDLAIIKIYLDWDSPIWGDYSKWSREINERINRLETERWDTGYYDG